MITQVNHDDGHVTSIESETAKYQAELFVDASGFKRLIANEISEFQYISKQDDMFVDSAFAFQCPHEGDNYPVFTTAQKCKQDGCGVFLHLKEWVMDMLTVQSTSHTKMQ